MKIKIGKAKWYEIGRQAGWTNTSRTAEFHYSNDELSGEIFGKQGLYYNVVLHYQQNMVDDSDYSRENGYGRLEVPTGQKEVTRFEIEEYSDSNEKIRDQKDILEMEPRLYQKIEQFAIENAEETDI